MPDLTTWPRGMWLIVPKGTTAPRRPVAVHRPRRAAADLFRDQHPQWPARRPGTRHRRRARCEDRIRNARDTGLRNLPLHDTAQNRIWLEIVQLALDLLAWMPMLALTGQARRWEPKKLRLRLFSVAARLVTTGHRRILRLARHWPWTHEITSAFTRLHDLPDPG